MTGNDDKILLDLNQPEFQGQLFEMDIVEVKKLLKTFKKLRGLTWNQLFKDHGFKWEALKSSPKYSIRLSQSYRALVMREDNFMRFQTLHPDHDSAYGKK